jgi:hypothetical protein
MAEALRINAEAMRNLATVFNIRLFLLYLTNSGAANIDNSEIAGHAAARVTRKRTLFVKTIPVRSKRQFPILVPLANSRHCPSRQ